MRKLNWDKELKKVQRRGLYNPKVRTFSIIAIAILTLGIGLTFSAFSYSSGDAQAFNSSITKKVNITVKATNGIIYKDNGHILSGTLASKILENNTVKTGPNFSASHTDNGLYVQKGDNTKSIDGKPTYYFRGNVTNNYVSFAGKTWRIIRINEDGTIRLIGTTNIENSTYGASTTYSGSIAESKLNAWYDTNLSSYDNYIATTKYCNEITRRGDTLNNTPSVAKFTCSNSVELKIGLYTSDEIVYSGRIRNSSAPTYLDSLSGWSWTMTGYYNGTCLTMGKLTYQYSDTNSAALYPVINLKAEALYKSGDGTESNPYVVEGISAAADTYTRESKYNQEEVVYINPYDGFGIESVSCTNEQNGSYDSATKKITITAKKDTTCTVAFKEMLGHKIIANNTLITTLPNFANGEPPVTGTNTGSGLYKMQDDDGDSYYFRGAIENNYVSFAGFTWRIIRINGDGTIRLMNEDSSITSMFNPLTIGYSSAGYTYNNTHVCTIENPCISSSGTDSKIKIALESWYETNLKGYDNYIALGIYCNDTTYTEISNGRVYSGSKRIAWDSDRNPSLKCPNPASTTDYGGVYKLKIGIISADEANIGGIGTYSYPASNNNYLVRDESYFTMTPNISTNYSDYFLGVYGGDGTIDDEYTTNYTGYHVVPVINLNKDSLVSSGDGTLNNPYVIE